MECPQYSTADPLTSREFEVLVLIAKGLSNREIGDELMISVKTIENHVHRILSKLGLPSRNRAIAVALQNGLVSLEMTATVENHIPQGCLVCRGVSMRHKEVSH